MANVPGMLPVMTTPSGTTASPPPASLPHVGNLSRLRTLLGADADLIEVFRADGPLTGSAMTDPAWHLATCHRCGDGLAEPFVDQHTRDVWAISHIAATGHAIVLSAAPAGAGSTVILRFGDRLWSWICAGCAVTGRERECTGTGFESGQLALAAYRRHVCGPAR